MSSTTTRKRMRRTSEQAREDILNAAEALLIEVGPQSLKLVDIAKRARIGHSLIIHHFGGIAAVQSALAVRMSRRLMDEVAELIETADFTGTAVRQITEKIFAIFGRPENAKLIAWLILSNETSQSRELAVQNQRINALIRQQLERSGRGKIATPQFVAGLQSMAMMAAIGEALGRQVISPDVDQALPKTQTRDWIVDLLLSKVDVGEPS